MEKMFFKSVCVNCRKLLVIFLTVLLTNVCNMFTIYAVNYQSEDEEVEKNGSWHNNGRSLSTILVFKNSLYLTIHDSNPINTITVKVTNHETSATVFENVYPQGQTSYIVIPISNWDAGSYTIELFGRENNGYLWGNFQVLH